MRELQWKPDQTAQLSVLSEGTCAGAVRIQELSGKRMRVTSGLAVNTGAAVKLEWDGQVIFGEALNSDAAGIWIDIHHMLLDTPGMNWQKQGWQRG